MQEGWHESLRGEQITAGSSDRRFGFVFGGVFGVLAALAAWHEREIWHIWLIIAVIFASVAQLAPRLLGPLNRFWQKLGNLLHRITNPVVMAMLFFAVIVPVGLMMRLRGNDSMRRKAEPAAPTYWIPRPTSTRATRMRKQF